MEVAFVGADGVNLREAEPGDEPVADGAYAWYHFDEPHAAEVRRTLRALGWRGFDGESPSGTRSHARLETVGDVAVLVVKTVWYLSRTHQIETGELAIYTDGHSLVTACRGSIDPSGAARDRLAQDERLRADGLAAAVSALLRVVVDGYDDAVEALAEDVSDLEGRVFAGGRVDLIEEIYFLIRETLEFQNAVQPLVPLARAIKDRQSGHEIFEGRRLRQLAGHLLRVDASVEGCMQLLATVLTAHQGQVATWQNDDMRTISAWAALALVPTVLTGVYGMNFEHMPELHWGIGYPVSLGFMALLCVMLYRGFKRSGWL